MLGDVNTSLDQDGAGEDDHRGARHQPAAALQPHQSWCRGPRGSSRAIPTGSTSKAGARRTRGSRRASSIRSSSIRSGSSIAAQQAATGHGGMDFLEDWRLIKCLREGTPTDMNVYDAAALSAWSA